MPEAGPRFRDDIGQWVICKDGRCDNCEAECYAYLVAELLWLPVPRTGTIIAHAERLGITCGCYGKLHRQVAHIQDAYKQREKP